MLLRPQRLASAIALLALTNFSQYAAAQVTTDCQPLNRTDCKPDPAFGMDYTFVFNQTQVDNTWETTAGTVSYDAKTGAAFTINKQGDSPTLRSKFYIFFGRVEILMKTAPGTGVISSVMMLSDDLDEIDWEFMGGNGTHAETNYFGKGVQDYRNAIYYPVNGGNQADYHNYTTIWTQDALQFFIDGAPVRTLLPKDANNTHYYPQTPMRLSLGIWAGGDPSLPQGTRDWAGGTTDYKKGPFTMYVKSVKVTDFSQGSKEYSYGDKSGSWQSIRVTAGNSTAHESIDAPPPESVSDKFNKLSPTAKIAIYASAGAVGAALVAYLMFYCIRQRRRGAREAKLAEARQEADRRELAAFKAAGIDPDSLAVEQSEYDAKEMHREGLTRNDSYTVPVTPNGPLHDKWETTAAAGGAAGTAGGARSNVPLLHDVAQSTRASSPRIERDPYSSGAYDRSPITSSPSYNSLSPRDRAAPVPPLVSPIRTASPGMRQFPSAQQAFDPPQNRSFSSPNPQMRVASPAGSGYGGLPQRTQSPAQMPTAQRSFTGGGYNSQQGGGYSAGGRGGYGNSNAGNDGYWGNGGYR